MREKRDNRESRPRSEPKLPKGHFNEDGLSQGKQTGPVRKTPDACNERGERNER